MAEFQQGQGTLMQRTQAAGAILTISYICSLPASIAHRAAALNIDTTIAMFTFFQQCYRPVVSATVEISKALLFSSPVAILATLARLSCAFAGHIILDNARDRPCDLLDVL